MNKAKTKHAVEVMQAYLDGKSIEYQPIIALGHEPWNAVGGKADFFWDWRKFNYRVKPAPRTFKVWARGNDIYPYHETQEISLWQSSKWKLIEVVEKIP